MSHLLLVDDDENLRLLIRGLLQEGGYQVKVAADGSSTLSAIKTSEPALIILDHCMPGMSGLEVCHVVKQNALTAHIPILMLTARSNIESKVESFEAGADDFLSKPFEPRELLARVAALLRLVRREGDRNPSTRLPGGQSIHEEIVRRAAQNEPFAICYFDLDHFKPFADTFGFAIADAIISTTGMALRIAVEAVDETHSAENAYGAGHGQHFVGHIGGDDFIVVTNQQQAEQIAEEAATNFEQMAIRILGDHVSEEHMLGGKPRRHTFIGVDRAGETQEFPLLQLSAVVLQIDAGNWVTPEHLGAFAAEVKRCAKQNGASKILMHRI